MKNKKLLQNLITNNIIIPSKTNVPVQNYIFLKWKYSIDAKHEKCPKKRKEAIDNLNKLVGKNLFD